MRWIPGLVVFCLLGAMASGVAAQDRVVLKNGSAFTGKILSDSGPWVVLEMAGGNMSFHREEVKKIERGASPVRGSDGKRSRNARRPTRGRSRGKHPKGGGSGFMTRAPEIFGDLKHIRVDRHPAYDCLKRSQIGAWVLYDTPRHLPHHDQERWVVHDVSRNLTVMLKKYLLDGNPKGFERVSIDHLDYGPAMPGRIQKSSTFGKEELKIELGQFASLRVTQESPDREAATMYYCPEVPLLGLVEDRQGKHVLRRLVGFGWEGGDVPRTPDGVANGSKVGARKKKPAAEKPPPPHPVAAAFLDAQVGDYAIWKHPASNRRSREIVIDRSPKAVRILVQVWKKDEFVTDGYREYDLGLMSGAYLDRFEAKRVGEETLTVAGRTFRCQTWRSRSGSARFWTSEEVRLGALVRHVLNGRVVRELEKIGHDPSLAGR